MKKLLKALLIVPAIPAIYLLVSLLFSTITINSSSTNEIKTEAIYLTTNGVHLDIVLPKQDLGSTLLNGLVSEPGDNYFSFGWGDEEFYLNTPYWSDLTISTAFNAAFIKGPSLVHVTRYSKVGSDWVGIKISAAQLVRINELLQNSFKLDANGNKMHLKGQGYSYNDDFYKAHGSYTFFTTCNSWVNTVFKQSGLKCSLWTPFDFGLMNKYK